MTFLREIYSFGGGCITVDLVNHRRRPFMTSLYDVKIKFINFMVIELSELQFKQISYA